jgi:hypothetical protein
MSIVLIIFWFDVLAAFICAATERFFLCGVNVVLAVLLAFIAMVYEGRLLNRVKKLEEEVALLRRGTIIREHLSQINDK